MFVQLETEKPLVCNLELPKASRRGEQLGAQVSMMNYFPEPIEVLVTVKASEQYL